MMARHRPAVPRPVPAPGIAGEAGSRPHGIAGCGSCAARRRKAQPMANRFPDLSRRRRSLIRNSNATRRDDELGIGPPKCLVAPGFVPILGHRQSSTQGDAHMADRLRAAEAVEPGAARPACAHGVPAPACTARSAEALMDLGPPGHFSGGPASVPIALNPADIYQLRSAAFFCAKAECFLIPDWRIDDAVRCSRRKIARIGDLAIAGYLVVPERIYDLHRHYASGLNRQHKAPISKAAGRCSCPRYRPLKAAGASSRSRPGGSAESVGTSRTV